MTRIVDPILADIRVENARPAWRGYAALARALAVHAIASAPSGSRWVWREDAHAMPRAAGLTMCAAMLTALPLVAPPLQATARLIAARTDGLSPIEIVFRSVLLLLPQALVLTLGPSLLLALPVALRGRTPNRRLVRRVVALSVVCTMATAALMLWAMPEANQAFRVLISGNMHLERGPNESGMSALRDRIATLSLTPGGAAAARSSSSCCTSATPSCSRRCRRRSSRSR